MGLGMVSIWVVMEYEHRYVIPNNYIKGICISSFKAHLIHLVEYGEDETLLGPR